MTTVFDVTIFYRDNFELFNISPSQLAIMVLIASINGKNDFPVNQKELIRLTRFSKRYLRIILKPLFEQKLISIEKIGRHNNYTLSLDKGDPKAPYNEKSKGAYRSPI